MQAEYDDRAAAARWFSSGAGLLFVMAVFPLSWMADRVVALAAVPLLYGSGVWLVESDGLLSNGDHLSGGALLAVNTLSFAVMGLLLLGLLVLMRFHKIVKPHSDEAA